MSDIEPSISARDELVQLDEDLARRDRATHGIVPAGSTLGAAVSEPGVASTVGARGARRAADVAGEPAGTRHSWIPIGPRNLAGRIRAMAFDPGDSRIAYAGSASGGVWKTVDHGETWFPLWHDEPQLSIGGLAVSPSNTQVVWAATGEITYTHAGRGGGVWRTTDGGATWDNPRTPLVPGAMDQFEVIAAHPTNENIAWAVGPEGILCIQFDGANVLTEIYRAGEHWSDVAITNAFVFLVRAATTNGEATVVRLDLADTPDQTTAAPDAARAALEGGAHADGFDTAIVSNPIAAGGNHRSRRGRIAIASTAGIAYARFAGGDDGEDHAGVFRCADAVTAASGSAMTWVRLSEASGLIETADEQGTYNLTVATTPDGTAIATGMVDLHLHRAADTVAPAANPDGWLKAMAWQYDSVTGVDHADHHVTLFVPSPDPPHALELWDADDGGIFRTVDWNDPDRIGNAADPVLPVPHNRITFRKRDHGIQCSQMYDLTQSPLVAGLMGCGYQDNGVYVSSGGPTWTRVIGADGGHVTFDPDDPYRILGTWQGGLAEMHVPGAVASALLPSGAGPNTVHWPRLLGAGFAPSDGAPFVAPTLHHPDTASRVLTARNFVLYEREPSGGDHWQPQQLGATFELRRVGTTPGTVAISVTATPGATRLGLPVTTATNRAWSPQPRIPSTMVEPYALQAGDQLQVVDATGAPVTVTFVNDPDLVPDVTRATASQVVAAINAVAPGLAQAVIHDPGGEVVTLSTTATNTPVTFAGDVIPLWQATSAIPGDPSRTTIAALWFDRNLTGRTLDITVGASPTVTVDFNNLADPANATKAGVAALVRAALAGAPATVGTVGIRKRIRINATTDDAVTVSGTAATPMGFTGHDWSRASRHAERFDLSPLVGPPPVDRALTITANGRTRTITFDGTNPIADLTNVRLEELVPIIQTALTTGPNPPPAMAELEVGAVEVSGHVTELAFSPHDQPVAWAGDSTGRLYRRDGQRWHTVTDPAFTDVGRWIGAIAFHPEDPDRMLIGLWYSWDPEGPTERFVFRSDDAGQSWNHAGTGIDDGHGNLVTVRAIVVDPDHPGVVFAGAKSGVFRSDDFGSSWTPFNEGLPNAEVVDLVHDPLTRRLEVGLWGRGVWHRDLGDVPVHDVRLVVRSNALDDGTRPLRRGPDQFARRPRPTARVSPDIKNVRLVAPFVFAATPDDRSVVDGTEFDTVLAHEPPTEGDATIAIQVHNRGAFPTDSARVSVLWAPVGEDVPDLTDDFFIDRAAGDLTPGDSYDAWTVISDGGVPDHGHSHHIVTPAMPRVLLVDHTWTAETIAHGRICILVVTSCAEDPLVATDIDVDRLGHRTPAVAWLTTDTLSTVEDERIVLRSTSGVDIEIDAPTTGGPAATLGLSIGGGALQSAISPAEPFDLDTGNPLGLLVRQRRDVVVTLSGSPDLRNPAVVPAWALRDLLNRDLDESLLPIRAELTDANRRVLLRATGASRFTVTAGPGATALGFVAGGPSATSRSNLRPFNLSAAGLELNLIVEDAADVLFPQAAPPTPSGTPEIADLTAARAHEVRAAINRQLRNTGVDAVAEPAHSGLRVRESATSTGPEPWTESVTGGAQYADLVVSTAAVADAGDRRALFSLPTVRGVDRAAAGTTNHLYVRVANVGNHDGDDVRCRLWVLEPGTDPTAEGSMTADALAAVPAQPIAAGRDEIFAFEWDPGVVDADAPRRLLLVVADRDVADHRVTVPADFDDADALDAFCRADLRCAVREVEVSP